MSTLAYNRHNSETEDSKNNKQAFKKICNNMLGKSNMFFLISLSRFKIIIPLANMGKVSLNFYITVSSCFMQCLQFDIYAKFAFGHARKNALKT